MKTSISLNRVTRETRIQLTLDLSSSGQNDISTGIGFLDHMLDSLARHAGWKLSLRCEGDLQVDDHHTAEDCAIVLGQALLGLVEDRSGLTRFGTGFAPLDEALCRAVVDLSGRPWPEVHLDLRRVSLGGLACENVVHFFNTLAIEGRFSLHLDTLRGSNDHHRVEAAFKALALALRQALAPSGSSEVPSTKGVLA